MNIEPTGTDQSVEILIVYHSMNGHTQRMAEHVAKGASSVSGARVEIKSVKADGVPDTEAATREDLASCDALIVGCPVHQRSISWEMKRFIDEHCEPCWFYDDMVGRVGGVFTTGGGHGDAGGGAELTQLSLISNLASMGVIVVPLPKTTPGFEAAGMHWGPNARTAKRYLDQVSVDDMEELVFRAAYHHGANIARLASALKTGLKGSLFATGNVAPLAQGREARMQMDGSQALGIPR